MIDALAEDQQLEVKKQVIEQCVKKYAIPRNLEIDDSVIQGKAAEVAGLTRAEFIAALSRFKVSIWQYTAEELEAELSGEDFCA
jgi:predicted HTH domain antitoxin